MKYYGQYDPPDDKILYEKYFMNYAKRSEDSLEGFFIECGAFDGQTECCCKFFEETLGWKGINIEASPRIFNRLLVNRPSSFLNLNIALSNKNGKATFKDVYSPRGNADNNGSLLHKEAHAQKIRDANFYFGTVEVETIRFADLMEKYQVKHVDLMALDVEGYEIEVLEGMSGSSVMPDVMFVEYYWSGLEKIKQIMSDYGYRFEFTKDNVNAVFMNYPPAKDRWAFCTQQDKNR